MKTTQLRKDLRDMTVNELLEKYKDTNEEIQKQIILKQRYGSGNKDVTGLGIKNPFSPGKYNMLKKQRAIILTILNQKGYSRPRT